MVDVEACDCVVGSEEVGCHSIAHGAEAGEGEFGRWGGHPGVLDLQCRQENACLLLTWMDILRWKDTNEVMGPASMPLRKF